MFLLSAPDHRMVGRFLHACREDAFSYPEVGATGRQQIPEGYNIDHNRQLLGHGSAAFELARAAINGWRMFAMPWVELVSPQTPIEVGRTVAIVVRHYGFYSLNAARVVYTIDESGDKHRFGFASGTLVEHGEIGEERFMVEHDQSSDEVWYDLFAFSRPASFLARLGYPLSRGLQKQFARDSKAAILSAVMNPADASNAGQIVLK